MMKVALSILMVILMYLGGHGQSDIRVGWDGVSMLNLESKKISLSDSYFLGELNYPRGIFSVTLPPMNTMAYRYSDGCYNSIPTYSDHLQYSGDGWLYHALAIGCEVTASASDPCGVLAVVAVYSLIYALEKRRIKKGKANLTRSQWYR